MNIHFNSASSHVTSFLRNNVQPFLAAVDKKILIIASITFGFFATYYLIRSKRFNLIEKYFKNFEVLSKSEKWEEIISQGMRALQEARKQKRNQDEAKICAQLASTAFYQGNYTQALEYTNCCHVLSQKFTDRTLLIRSLYLQSAVHRALAGKHPEKEQELYSKAVEDAEKALVEYMQAGLNNGHLSGKIYLNLGAAHADNPKGNLQEAINCYRAALECFERANAHDDGIRVNIRLGKIYLLQKDYVSSQEVVNRVRLQPLNERLMVHVDYLEAQLHLATNHVDRATEIATRGLARAKSLGAKEDAARFISLMQTADISLGNRL